MQMNPYLGHASQLSGVEEVRLVGGKGDGMRLLQVRNGRGLELTISADRCADLSRVHFKGDNMGFFSPCGYVAPAYYDDVGKGFLKSFTAGFLTTCGLTTLGAPCTDDGEQLPLHGTIANQPCERIWWTEDDSAIEIHAIVSDSEIFSRKLELHRVITVSKTENELTITDTVENRGDAPSPFMMMYHMNMGYPLLSERSVVRIDSCRVTPTSAHAAEDLETWDKMLPPTPGFDEQCYFHEFAQQGRAGIYNPDIGKGLEITFDPRELPAMVEWKMMGVRDYVLGLEPRTCPSGSRPKQREAGTLEMLAPGASRRQSVRVRFYEEAK